MPNHCENDLVVIGPKDDVERFVRESTTGTRSADAGSGEELHLDFNTAVPYPEKWKAMDRVREEYDKETRRLREEAMAKLRAENAPEEEVDSIAREINKARWDQETRPKDGYNQGGYDWCIDNWGTKWNAYSTHSISIEPVDDTTNSILHPITPEIYEFKISFDTAWSPPTPAIRAWAAKYPSLEISLHWFEAGMGFCGSAIWNGEEKLQETNGDYHGHRGG